MKEVLCTVEPWGQNSLALNYISQHDRKETECSGLGVKVPDSTAL